MIKFYKYYGKIEDRIKDLEDIYENIKIESEILRGIESKRLELDNHIKIKPQNVINTTSQDEVTYQKINDNINKHKLILEEIEGEIRELEKLKKWLADYKNLLKGKFIDDCKTQLNNMKFIKKEIIGNLELNININGIDNIDNRILLLEQQKVNLMMESEKLENDKKVLEEKLKKYEEEKQILGKWYNKKLELEKEIKDLEKQLEVVENNKFEIKNIKIKIMETYIELIKTKFAQKQKYEEMKQILEEDEIIQFGVKIEFDEERFLIKKIVLLNTIKVIHKNK